MGSPRAEKAADLIEAQAKQAAERDERIAALEAKCALLAASLAQEERRSAELEARIDELEDENSGLR